MTVKWSGPPHGLLAIELIQYIRTLIFMSIFFIIFMFMFLAKFGSQQLDLIWLSYS